MKKVFYLLIILLSFSLFSCDKKSKDANIISTCFAGYDFSRAVAKDLKTSKMLLNPGEELHDYSPTINEIESIIKSDIFIYIGGESDEVWVEKQILPELDNNKTKVINMMDVVKNKGNVYNEEAPESSFSEEEEEDELDEHVWNSISNAKIIVEAICNTLVEIDVANKDQYIKNKNDYINSLNVVDQNIKNVVSSSNKKMLIFADRFPLLYFVRDYGLAYDAAFKGCETAKEPNPKTSNSLINKIKDNNIRVIFIIEKSETEELCDNIVKECKKDGIELEKRVFYTMHTISKNDYDKNLTYVDYMNKNIESLKKALK